MLKTVISIKRTQHEDMLDFRLIMGDGRPVMAPPATGEGEPPMGPEPTGEIEWSNEREVEYTWKRGDTASIGPELDMWLDANPDFPIAPADPIAPPVAAPRQPTLFAAVAVTIAGSAITVIEQAAQLASATYDDGWIMVGFTSPQDTADYLIFAQTDVPTKIEQFKSEGYFELVFSDPVNGAPLEPGRIDIQVLKVR